MADEASGTVNVFGVDRRSGLPTDTGRAISVPDAGSVTFCRT